MKHVSGVNLSALSYQLLILFLDISICNLAGRRADCKPSFGTAQAVVKETFHDDNPFLFWCTVVV